MLWMTSGKSDVMRWSMITLVLLTQSIWTQTAGALPVEWSVQECGNGQLSEAALAPEGITWGTATGAVQGLGGNLVTTSSAAERALVFGWGDRPEYWHTLSPPAQGSWIDGYQGPNGVEPGLGRTRVVGAPLSLLDAHTRPGNGPENRRMDTHVTATILLGSLSVAGCGLVLAARAASKSLRTRRRAAPLQGTAELNCAAWAATAGSGDPASGADGNLPETAPTPWQVLGLQSGASWAEIRRAFRMMIIVHHPDRGGDLEMAKQIVGAYRTLRSTSAESAVER